MLAHMADWRQIQARIRKAKASPDAPAQLAELYERTRDAMVALELAQWHEKAGDNGEAVRWYTAAAERFRRAQWRTKAEEALTRLGAAIPTYTSETVPEPKGADARAAKRSANANAAAATPPLEKGVEKGAEKAAESTEEAAVDTASGPNGDAEESPAETAAQTAAEGDPASKKRRRRGRRGGRKRRSGSGAAQAQSGSANTAGAGGAAAAVPQGSRQTGGLGGATFPSVSPAAELSEPQRREFGGTPSRPSPPQTGAGQHSSMAGAPAAEAPSPVAAPLAERDVSPPPERGYESAPAPSWQGRTRAGEPALASRISQLESQLRRLLACPLGSLDDADLAPAGPGVLLLSDSDQVTHYYIESCQTLRIGIGNLLRGGRGSKDSGLLKARMAENLGIAELRVSRYLKEHCAVRWLQLDEGAPELAHFAIAVLRPVVNE
jgi:hypothetical protein